MKPQRHQLTPTQEEVFGVLPHPANRQEPKVGRSDPGSRVEASDLILVRVSSLPSYVCIYTYPGHQILPLSQFPLATQERLLVEDLLWAVAGYEGKYIKIQTSSSSSSLTPSADISSSSSATSLDEVQFVLVDNEQQQMDRSLASMATKFLPLGAYCVRIRKFIDIKRR